MTFFQRLQDGLGWGEPFNQAEFNQPGYVNPEAQGFYPDSQGFYPETQDFYPDSHANAATPTHHEWVPDNRFGMSALADSLAELVVMEPHSFEEAFTAVKVLCEHKAVILNLTFMDADQAQRSADYVAGGTFALDGHQQRLGEGIFLFTPSFVAINNCPTVQSPVSQMSAQPHHPHS
ncbi:MAG: cell division protein SepF [Cyanothece sp. SIO1E1]|nr:cell division protein SepF [Cyanothece sp. SIO1E1]